MDDTLRALSELLDRANVRIERRPSDEFGNVVTQLVARRKTDRRLFEATRARSKIQLRHARADVLALDVEHLLTEAKEKLGG